MNYHAIRKNRQIMIRTKMGKLDKLGKVVMTDEDAKKRFGVCRQQKLIV